jgi:hypothetical protein
MAKNDPDHPEVARRAQDVEAPVHREPEGNFHYGRGGAANVAKPAEEEAKARKSVEERRYEGNGDHKGLAEKGKEMLEKLTGKR